MANSDFYPTESHNGYLEVANDLGFIGLAACIGYLIVYVRQSLKLMRMERNQGILYLCIFFQNALGNLSESYWLQNHFAFLILMLATFGTARAFLDQRLQNYFGAPAAAVAVPRR
jgi:O-antigen ligase